MPNRTHIIFFLAVFTLLFLAGCMSGRSYSTHEEQNYVEIPDDTYVIEAVVDVIAEIPGPMPFSVLYSTNEITGAIYEPAVGAYLGAWLRPDIAKATFERMADKKHAVFAMEMSITDDFPTTWILQSIAAQAAPLIVLNLADEGEDDFPLAELASFAYELGNFNLPSFIVFNPLPSKPNISPDDYILLFRYARIIFRTYAPMAAFVWHGYDNTATPDSPFYPGHDVVDWVSLEALAPQDVDGFIIDIPSYLKPFYLSFQRHKPIILLPLGVGHFSRRDYIYRVPQAAAEITRVYNTLRDLFPRVRLVVYGNHNISSPYWDDFSLTREDALMSAYREAIADIYFLSRLISGDFDGLLHMRSALHGYYYQGEVFIDHGILEARQHRPIPTATKEINGRMYVNTNDINWMKVAADHTRQVIYIQ